MKSVVGITGEKLNPSTRFRWSQYSGYLAKDLNVFHLDSKNGAYAPEGFKSRLNWGLSATIENAFRTARSTSYDVRFLQRNLMARIYSFERFMKPPFVFDVDDAIFSNHIFGSARLIARRSSVVTCGNLFLAEYFSKFAKVELVPTAVDTSYYVPLKNDQPKRRQLIGWSGSSSGFIYLNRLQPVLKRVLQLCPDAVLKVISDKPPTLTDIPQERIDFEYWSLDREVAALQEFSVGLMPLVDDVWSRGKCSYKMLTYMAVGVPVVVSPYGMNADVLALGHCGYGPRNVDEWIDALCSVLKSESEATFLGNNGRQIVNSHFRTDIVAQKLSRILLET